MVESEHREAILPLVLGGVGLAVFDRSWASSLARAGRLVSYLEPATYLDVVLASRTGSTDPGRASVPRGCRATGSIGDAYRSGRHLVLDGGTARLV